MHQADPLTIDLVFFCCSYTVQLVHNLFNGYITLLCEAVDNC